MCGPDIVIRTSDLRLISNFDKVIGKKQDKLILLGLSVNMASLK